MSEQALTFLRTLVTIMPSLSLFDALNVADAAFSPEPVAFPWATSTLAQRVAKTRTLPSVMNNLPERKIQAIKEIRSIASLSLMDAKNVIDAIQPPTWRCAECAGGAASHYSWCSQY